jgi:crossover junction endodeoxyribonuclease RuvC
VSPAKRVIGLDPGTITAGYGIVERRGSRLHHIDNGLLMAPKRAPLPERLRCIYEQLQEVFAKHSPDVVAVESVFFSQNAKAALHLGHARGVLLLAAAQNTDIISSFAPTKVKQTLTGRGRATKLQVQMMVKTLLGLPEPPAEDAADALAVALCHFHHETENVIRDRAHPRRRR